MTTDSDLTLRVGSFEGPFDLLLHLCRTNEIDLAALPVRAITDQYLAHLGVFLFIIASFVGFLGYRVVRRTSGISFTAKVAFGFFGLLIVGTVVAGQIGWLFDTLPMPFYVHDLTAGGFLRDVVGGVLVPLPGSPPIASSDGMGQESTTPVVAFALFALALLAIVAWGTGRKRPRSDG